MKPNSAKAKGNLLEDWIVNRLILSGLDTRAYRQKGSGSGLNKGDVWNSLNLCIEAKNQTNFKPAWFKQAEKESLGQQEPVVVWHPPNKPLDDSKVFINWNYYEKLLLKAKEPKSTKPTRDFRWRLENLKSAIQKVLKELK
jgi:hypothetical protein